MQYLRLPCTYVMCIFLETGVLFQKVMTIATKSKKIADLLWRYSKFYYLEKSFCNILQMLHVSLYKYL